jgi:hypothetical protein
LVLRPLEDLFYQLWMVYGHGAVSGMRTVRGNESTWQILSVSLHSPKLPHDLTWDQTRTVVMGT